MRARVVACAIAGTCLTLTLVVVVTIQRFRHPEQVRLVEAVRPEVPRGKVAPPREGLPAPFQRAPTKPPSLPPEEHARPWPEAYPVPEEQFVPEELPEIVSPQPRKPPQPPPRPPPTEPPTEKEKQETPPVAGGLVGFLGEVPTEEGQEEGPPPEEEAQGPPGEQLVEKNCAILPPIFRQFGLAIGDACEFSSTGQPSFPLILELGFDPEELRMKGITDPKLIEDLLLVFFFDQTQGGWSEEGINRLSVDLIKGIVRFETMHLTVFRLGFPRNQAPTAHRALPTSAAPSGSFNLYGANFSPVAARNVITFGGAFVMISLNADGAPRPLNLNDQGETIMLQSAEGNELDRATVEAAPGGSSSWNRQKEKDPSSPFVDHRTLSVKPFSPGATARGSAFLLGRGGILKIPQAGDLVINEVLLVPPGSFLGDANGDGERRPDEDEFIELISRTDGPLDLSGIRVVTKEGERHRFPEGTTLPAGHSMVVFSGGEPAGPFGSAATVSPVESAMGRLDVELLDELSFQPGHTLLNALALRQSSNPLEFHVLARVEGLLRFALSPVDRLPQPSDPLRMRVLSGDVDRDLDVDLVGVAGNFGIALWLNNGTGRFSDAGANIQIPGGVNLFFDAALADLTGDGAPEILVGDTDERGSYVQLVVLMNDGAGQFQQARMSGARSPGTVRPPATLAAGDLDQNGDLDVLVGIPGGQALLFRQGSDGTFQPESLPFPTSEVVPSGLELVDVDRDGDLDVFIAAGREGLGGSNGLQLFLNQGQEKFDEATTEALPLTGPVDALAVGDVDQDHDVDLIIGERDEPVLLLLNDGQGTFRKSASGIEARSARDLLLADFDGDGDLDLAIVRSGQSQLLVNDGSGTMAEAQDAFSRLRGDQRHATPIDVDNDGDLDLVFLDRDGRLSLLTNLGFHTNRAPELDQIDDKRAKEGRLLRFMVSASDPDGDELTFSAQGLPQGATLTKEAEGQALFEWTPAQGQGSKDGTPYHILFQVSDGIELDEELVTITVFPPNTPPTLAPIGDREVDEQLLLEIPLAEFASDADPHDVLRFRVEGLPQGAELNQATGLFQWTPGPRQGGDESGSEKYPVKFIVDDGFDTDSQTITITVKDVNHPPVLEKIGDKTVDEGKLLEFVVKASDQDQDHLTANVFNPPFRADFDPEISTFRWQPDFTQAGEYPGIRFEVRDPRGLTDEETIRIMVNNVNRPPQLVLDPPGEKRVNEGELIEFLVSAVDPDGEPVTIRLIQNPEGSTFENGLFRWRPTFEQAGDHNVVFELRELSGPPVAATVPITVLNVNRPPELASIPDQTTLEGNFLQFAIEATDPDREDQLTIMVEPLPDGARLVDQASKKLFQWMPGGDQAGQYTLTIQVTDGQIPQPITDTVIVTVLENPGFQRLQAQVGMAVGDADPLHTSLGSFGQISPPMPQAPPMSLGVDLSEIHPAVVSMIELFATTPVSHLMEDDLPLFVSDNNATYQPYTGSRVFSPMGHQIRLSNLNIPQRFIKIHLPNLVWPNFLSESIRVSGAIPHESEMVQALEDLAHKTFLYFKENVNGNGLIPDRVIILNGQPAPGHVFSTGATGFWLASLPIAVEHEWVTREEAILLAKRTLEFYLGLNGGPVDGHLGFFYHFLNGDGTRFTEFGDDGVSILDSTLLFVGALACGEFFEGEIRDLAQALYDQADWDGFFGHDQNQLRLVWTPERGFQRTLDYYSEGILAYLLAAGSTTHPVFDPDLPPTGADAYYAFSRGNFGRVLGRFGRDGRPLIQSFFGSLFTYLYPNLFVNWQGLRDAFFVDWAENAREAILANFAFAQANPEFGYSRLLWGISASDGPFGYQGLYGAKPLDPKAGEACDVPPGEACHDGTVSPYAVAGSLAFVADLALPALQHMQDLASDRLVDRYGLKDAVNVNRDFFDPDYLGIDQGALLLGIENYRSQLVPNLVSQSSVIQRAFERLGIAPRTAYQLEGSAPRDAHAYLLIDTTDHLIQHIEGVGKPTEALAGDALLELHPFGMDNALGKRLVAVQVKVNGQGPQVVRFEDRRGTGDVDVGSVYVPISPASLTQEKNTIELQWMDGERWVQLEDVEVRMPTGRRGSQEAWTVGFDDGSFGEFGNELFTDDSYIVGDNFNTFEQALNVVNEPVTDILFELNDTNLDRLLRLKASATQDNRVVGVEVFLNKAPMGMVELTTGSEATVDLSHAVLREGWNHLALRHANRPGDGEFILWDFLKMELKPEVGAFQALIRNLSDQQFASTIQFGVVPPEGSVALAQQFLEIRYNPESPPFDRITISTDNRDAPVHRFTGPSEASAAGLVGEIDSTLAVPLLWQVYDDLLPSPPVFTNTVQWAFVPDQSEENFNTPDALEFRTLVSREGLGTRPPPPKDTDPKRQASPPIVVYLVADFRGKPAQGYTTARLLLELIEQ